MEIRPSIINSANYGKPVIDSQALIRVSSQILKPENEKAIDISKLNLSGFHRVQLGTDLYAEKTNTYLALEAAKAKTSFDIHLSNAASANIQYLNAQAAQSSLTAKDRNGQLSISVEAAKEISANEIVLASSQVTETQDMNKDKKGQNPFSFYVHVEKEDKNDENDIQIFKSIDFFA